MVEDCGDRLLEQLLDSVRVRADRLLIGRRLQRSFRFIGWQPCHELPKAVAEHIQQRLAGRIKHLRIYKPYKPPWGQYISPCMHTRT